MDKFETRRLALQSMIDSLGRGGVAAVAARIGKAPDYVSRMLYEPGKEGKKNIGEATWDILLAAYPKELGRSSRMHEPMQRADPESELRSLREQVDTLSITLMGLLRVTAQHRPVEAEALVAAIRGNQELDMYRRGQLQDVLRVLEMSKEQAAKPSARARAKPASR